MRKASEHNAIADIRFMAAFARKCSLGLEKIRLVKIRSLKNFDLELLQDHFGRSYSWQCAFSLSLRLLSRSNIWRPGMPSEHGTNDALRQLACLTDCVFFVFSIFRFFKKKFGWGALPARPPEFWPGGLRPARPPP